MRTFIRPYNIGSESARMLAQSLQVKRIKGDKRIINPTTLINWGGSTLVNGNVNWINHPNSVALAKNKLKTFLTLTKAGVYTPPFTTNHAVAKAWVDAGEVVYGRKYLEASQGEGIVVITQDSGWEMCPLYTKGVMKTHEYRVHVVNGRVIDFSKKRRRSEQESNPYIKNSNNGWVFCREGVELPNAIADAAIKSVAALSLHFGAVDVAYKERDDRAYVFEVNTAPGIEGTTLTKYTEALRGYVYAPVQSRGYSHHQERIRWSR